MDARRVRERERWGHLAPRERIRAQTRDFARRRPAAAAAICVFVTLVPLVELGTTISYVVDGDYAAGVVLSALRLTQLALAAWFWIQYLKRADGPRAR
jgi:hypothetical protein